MIRTGIVICGGILVHLCLGCDYVFGNISIYMISYLRNRTEEYSLRNVDSLWISNGAAIVFPFSIVIGGVSERYLGVRLTTAIGCMIFSSGVALTFFTVKKSLFFVCLTFGGVMKLGSGIAYGPPIQTAVKWIPHRPTFATGLIVCGYGGGAIILNQIVTAYLNPENLAPDLEVSDGEKYFTDTALLDRVPKLFLLLACIFVACQTVGIIALSEPRSGEIVPIVKKEETFEKTEEKLPVRTVLCKIMKSKNAVLLLLYIFLMDSGHHFAANLYKANIIVSYFINIFLLFACSKEDIAQYPQAYGQTFISDDRFLALIGSVSSIFNCLGRPFWGAVMDKYGFQIAVKFVAAMYVCFSCTILYTESLGKVAFMVWICGLYGSFCGIWAIGPSTLGKLFGVENLIYTMGATMSAASVASVTGGLIGLNLQSEIGWRWLYILSGFMGATAMIRRIIFIVGGMLVHLCLGSYYIFGNISLYMISYLRNRTEETSLRNVDNLWISGVAAITTPIGMTSGGVLNRYLGVRPATAIGCMIFCSGVALTYFTVKKSLFLVCLTYGALMNLGYGIAYGPPIYTAMKWIPKRPTLATGLIVGGFGGGAVIFNQVVTAFVNPHDHKPDLTISNGGKYFTQTEILDRVPGLFLLLGGIYITCQTLGIIALLTPRSTDTEDITEEDDAQRSDEYERLEAMSDDDERLPVRTVLLNIVKSKDAMILLIIVYLIYGGNVFAISLYKAYGETFITNDQFLAAIGSVSSIFNCLGRPLWGAIMDRYGFHIAVKLLAITFVLLASTLQVTEYLGEVAFMLWICGLYGSFCGIWAIGPSTLAKLFGVENMVISLGALFMAVFAAVVSSILIDINLKPIIGWHWIFIISGCMGVIAFFISFLFDGKDRDGNTI